MLHTAGAKSSTAAAAAAFVAGLKDEQVALTAMTGLLQAEQGALVAGDAERVAELAADKGAQIELLTRLGELRKRHLAAQNLSTGAEGVQDWLRCNPGFAAPAGKLWRELLAQAETARQINQSNGLLIDARLQQNRLKLAVLQSAAAADGVYRADGQLLPLRSARSLSLV